MRRMLLSALLSVIFFTVVLGLGYGLAFTGVAQVLFPGKADGSKISVDGKVVGSSLIAQSFSKPVIGKNGKPKLDEEGEEVLAPDPAYFQPRPSQTGYAPNTTYFSNLGPNSVEEREVVREYLKGYLALEKPFDHSLTREDVPVDADHPVGLRRRPRNLRSQRSDPGAPDRRRPQAAAFAKVEDLISAHTNGRFLGVFGEPGVNVLELNIALDKEAPIK